MKKVLFLMIISILILTNISSENKKNNELENALFEAVKSGNIEEVKKTIEKGVDVNVRDYFNVTILMFASFDCNFEIVKYLIEEKRADINAKDDLGETALLKACGEGNFELVRYLIEKGADINAIDNCGRSVLIWAKKLEIVKYLIEEKGVDINVKDNESITVLMYACENCHLDIVKYLINKGADVNTKDNNGRTSLDYAEASVKEETELIDFMKDSGAKKGSELE
jgi:ankyrin repeat protein